MDFEQAFEEFKIYASKRHKKQCFETISSNIRIHVLPYFKGKTVDSITIQDIISWQDNILDKNYKNNTNKNIYCAFNSFLRYCVLNSYITTNLLSVVGCFKKKIEVKEYRVYNLIQYLRFRSGIHHIIYRFFFDLMFFYGPRSGEVMAVKFSDLKGKYLHIGKSIQRRGERLLDTPKTANSDRYLCLGIIMRIELLILKCYYCKYFGDSFDYFIFGGLKPLSPTSINRYKRRACDETGIFEITTHEFRHSYATRMIKKGVSIDKVSKSLGHSSVSITLDVYVHNEKRELHSLSSKIDFLETISNNLKKIIQSIITHFIV